MDPFNVSGPTAGSVRIFTESRAASLARLPVENLRCILQTTQSVRGTFVDVNGKGESRVRDVHFDAVHALRFVGYLLRQAGARCLLSFI